MNLGRRTVLAALLASAGPAGFAAAQALPPAAAPIRALDNGLLAVMKAGEATPFSRRFDMLAPVVDRVFDLPEILRASVGPRWSSFRPAEQHALITAFRQFT